MHCTHTHTHRNLSHFTSSMKARFHKSIPTHFHTFYYCIRLRVGTCYWMETMEQAKAGLKKNVPLYLYSVMMDSPALLNQISVCSPA